MNKKEKRSFSTARKTMREMVKSNKINKVKINAN